MTHPDGSNKIGHKPPGSPAQARALLAWTDSGMEASMTLATTNASNGIAAIANWHVFVSNAHYVIGNLRTWGWITLIIAILQLAAAAGILAGTQLARWFAVAVLALNAIDMMFFVPAYPFWALTIIAMDAVALYGLCAYPSRANLAASAPEP
jgi:hypothetical protein